MLPKINEAIQEFQKLHHEPEALSPQYDTRGGSQPASQPIEARQKMSEPSEVIILRRLLKFSLAGWKLALSSEATFDRKKPLSSVLVACLPFGSLRRRSKRHQY